MRCWIVVVVAGLSLAAVHPAHGWEFVAAMNA